MRIIEDFICIILLLLMPDFILEKTGLLKSIDIIVEERRKNDKYGKRNNTQVYQRIV